MWKGLYTPRRASTRFPSLVLGNEVCAGSSGGIDSLTSFPSFWLMLVRVCFIVVVVMQLSWCTFVEPGKRHGRHRGRSFSFFPFDDVSHLRVCVYVPEVVAHAFVYALLGLLPLFPVLGAHLTPPAWAVIVCVC